MDKRFQYSGCVNIAPCLPGHDTTNSCHFAFSLPVGKIHSGSAWRTKKFIWAFSLLSLFSSVLIPVSGGAATLAMESFLGFNEHFHPGDWTPLTLTLENRGRDVQGRLEVIVTSGSEFLQNIYQSAYSADVELPYNAKRLYAFSIKLESFTHDLQIRLKQGDEFLLNRSISLRSAVIEKPFVLIADEKASPDFLSDFPSQVFPVNVRPKFLPEHSYAYQSVRMMILNVEILSKLREKQFHALLKWIKQGGYLVLTGGMNVGAFSESRVHQLFPAQIRGHREFTELRSLKDFCGKSFRSPAPFLLLHIQSQDAKTLLRERGLPVLAIRELGEGRILFSAFHYHVAAFRSWDGKFAFWKSLLALHDPTKDDGPPELPISKVQETMLFRLPSPVPNPKYVILLLGMYLLLLGWISRRIQRRGGPQWGSVLAFLALTLVSALGSYLVFRVHNQHLLYHDAFLHVHGGSPSQQAEVNYITGLYTIRATDYILSFDAASYPLQHLSARLSPGAFSQAYRIHQSPRGQEIYAHSEDWQTQFFQLSDTREFPLSAKAGVDEKGVELQIRNDSERMIQDLLLYNQQNLYTLGTLQAGKDGTFFIPREAMKEKEVFNPRDFTQVGQQKEKPLETSADETPLRQFLRETFERFLSRQNSPPYMLAMQEKLLPDALEAVHERYRAEPDVLCLVGWLPGSLIDMELPQHEAPGEALTLVTWEFPLQKYLGYMDNDRRKTD